MIRSARRAQLRRRGLPVAIAVLLVSALVGAPAQAAPAGSGPDPAPPHATAARLTTGGKPTRITLITGDVVTYMKDAAGRVAATVTPGADRAGVTFNVRTEETGYHVYPDDVAEQVRAGLLDSQLFNIEYLATHGYTDEASGQLALIAQYGRDTGSTTVDRKSRSLPGRVRSATLPSIHGAAVRIDKKRAGDFWKAVRGTAAGDRALTRLPRPAAQPVPVPRLGADLAKLWLDGKVSANDDVSAAQIGAPAAWATGLQGTGVTVGIIDTGIDARHPDLVDRVATARNFVPAGQPGGGDPADTTDRHGHGTHVASIIAGSGAASGGKYKGVAYGARLAIAKGLDDRGSGAWSTIIEAMEWQAATQHSRIVSMSLGGEPTDGTDPVSQTVNDLTARYGTLFVIAAGNAGPSPGTVATPGAATAALTVGAVDSADTLAGFSSRGPRLGNDYAVKPEITAPGWNIAAARAAGTSLGSGSSIPGGGPIDDYYTKASGTSMATPHVAAAAAILLQQHADWTASELKNALVGTAKDIGYTAYEQGAGRLDVGRAVNQRVFADTSSMSASFTYPYTDQTLTRRVTYRNSGSAPVTLSVSAPVKFGGEPAPPGMVTVSASSLTVPAGGTAGVDVTVEPMLGDPGFYTGQVVADDDNGARIAVPIGFRKFVKTHKVRIRVVAGGAFPVFSASAASAALLNDTDPLLRYEPPVTVAGGWYATEEPGTYESSMYLPEGGVYQIEAMIGAGSLTDDRSQIGVLIRPEVRVDADTTVTFRADELAPVRFNTPQPSQCATANFMWTRSAASGSTYFAGSLGVHGLCATVTYWFSPSSSTPTVGRFQLQIDHTRIASQVAVSLAGDNSHADLHPWYYSEWNDVPKFISDRHVATAAESDLRTGRNVRGKLIITDPIPFDGFDTPGNRKYFSVLDLAEAAGAAGVLTDSSYFWHSTLQWKAAHPHTPLLWVPDTEGEQARAMLAGAARPRADIHTRLDLPYEYKLIRYHNDRIPTSLTFSPTPKELARIDTTYHAQFSSALPFGPAPDTNESNVTFTPVQRVSIKASHAFPGGTSRTEYFSLTGPEVIWDRLYDFWDPDVGGIRVALAERGFTEATVEQEHWNEGVRPAQLRPGPARPEGILFDIPCDGCRQGDTLRVRSLHTLEFGQFTDLGDAGHQVFEYGATEDRHLYRAGTEIQPRPDEIGLPFYAVPADAATYTFTDEFVDSFAAPHTATRVATTWTFRSGRPGATTVSSPHSCVDTIVYGDSNPCAWLPLIYLNYRLGLPANDSVPAGKPFIFTIAPDTGQGAVVPVGLRVWFSADRGGHWTEAAVVPGPDHTFRVVLTNPTLAQSPSDTVSLKARARDDAGNSVEQIVTDAYLLR